MKFISPLQKDKGPISSAAKAEMEEEETQDESEETVVSHSNQRPRKLFKKFLTKNKAEIVNKVCDLLNIT